MERKRSDKLEELKTLLETLKEEERKAEAAQNAILKILPEVTEARSLLSVCQTTYTDHLNFLRSNNKPCPSAKMKEFERLMNAFRKLIETFSPIFKDLRVLQADIVSKINVLGQMQTMIEGAKTVADLNKISFGAPFPLATSPPPDADQVENEWKQVAVLDKVKECLVELRIVVEEEKAGLTGT